MIDLTDFQQRKIAFAILRWTNESRNSIASPQIETSDLAGANIDIIGTGQIGTISGSQEPKTILQNLEDTITCLLYTSDAADE